MNISKRLVQMAKIINYASDTIKMMAKSGSVSLHKIDRVVKESVIITDIYPTTGDAEELKRLHEMQDKLLRIKESRRWAK